MTPRAQRLIFYAGLLGLWAWVAHCRFWPPAAFPPPYTVALTLQQDLRDSLGLAVWVSLRRVGAGYVLSAMMGILLGLVTARMKWLENTLGSLMVGLQSLPSICWLPAALLWFGPTDAAILFVVIMGSMLSICIGTHDAVKNLPPIYINAARTLGIPEFRIYRDVVFPACLPSIVSTLKQGWVFAWRSLLGAELLSTVPGLGNLLKAGKDLNQINQVVALMLVIMALGWAVDYFIFSAWEKHVRHKRGMMG